MLYRHRSEHLADDCEHRVAVGAHVVPHADLDQFMRLEIDVDFAEHRRGDTVLPYADDGMKVMRLRAKLAALTG